ncbi:MAG: ABC transporter permease subunit [Oscillospiraceae bacterium]
MARKEKTPTVSLKANETGFKKWLGVVKKDFKMHRSVYMIAIPGILFYLIFLYAPMYGTIIGFKNYSPGLGIMGSPWVGFKHFQDFFSSIYFGRIVKNTLVLNFYLIVFAFPAPIILALMLNEVRKTGFKRGVQTITYLPHFISMVVICGMITEFTSSKGFITTFVNMFGGEHVNLLQESELFKTIYVLSDIWQATGWGSVIYIAALSGVDTELYEAAEIDGAGKWRQLLSVTLPGISSTIVIMFILRIGNIMTLGADKVILLYNPVIYESSDIISSFIYRKGLQESNQSYATAVGLFNSVINFALVFGANKISQKFSESSLW